MLHAWFFTRGVPHHTSSTPRDFALGYVARIFWPIADMAHSIIRRRLGRKRPDRPDMMHMHHVVMRTLAAYSGRRITRQIANP